MIHLITGGSASGKSAYAEAQAVAAGKMRYYIATMRPYGTEGEKRVAKHRAMRAGKGFFTIECYTDLESVSLEKAGDDPAGGALRSGGSGDGVSAGSSAQADGSGKSASAGGGAAGGTRRPGGAQPGGPADDMGSENRVILLECMSNLTANELFDVGGSGEEICRRIMAGIRHLQNLAKHLIIVTNEVFSDELNYDPDTLGYIRLLGRINRLLAEQAGRVTEVVYGLPVEWKRSPKAGDKME